MNKQHKIISIIIIILLVIIGVYGYINYKNEMENNEFKEILKNASDIENITDKSYTEMYSGKSIRIDEYLTFTKSNVENTSKELDILIKFKNKTSNQTQKEFLEMQIKRLEKENIEHKDNLDIGEQCKRYLNGEITANKYNEILEKSTENHEQINDEISKIKEDTMVFIDNHPDLKSVLEEIGVDEDFYLNEKGEQAVMEEYILLNRQHSLNIIRLLMFIITSN